MSHQTVTYTFKAVDRITGLMDKITRLDKKIQSGFSRLPKVVSKATAPVAKLTSKTNRAKVKIAEFANLSVRKLQAFGRQADQARKKFGNFINRSIAKINRFTPKINPLGGLIAGAFSVVALTSFGGSIVNTIAKFERFEAVLENTLGSNSAAKTVLRDITDFAGKTPFQVDELTDSWVRLANQGLTLNMKQFRKLGDLASSTGKGITQLAEAVLDAGTNEFERLKEFGIKASSHGDRVKFTFKGITTEVGKNANEINNYLLGLGDLKGVEGAMKKIMPTVGGMVSNMKDRFMNLQKNIGETFRPVIVQLIGFGNQLIDKLQGVLNWVNENKALTKKWAARVILVVAAFAAFFTIVKVIAAISLGIKGVVFVFGLLKKLLVVARFAMIAFNFVASLSPFGWIAIAVGAIFLLLLNFKKVRQFLWNLTKLFVKYHPFTWMIDLIDRVFPGFKKSLGSVFNWVIDGFKKAYNWLKDKIFKPIGKFFSWLWGEATKDIEVNNGDPVTFKTELEDGVDPYSLGLNGKSNGSAKGGKTVNDRLNSVSSGVSSSIKHITITIGSLIESMNFNTENLPMSKEMIKAEVTRVLLGVVNDVNHI